jgi:hypothetical protein
MTLPFFHHQPVASYLLDRAHHIFFLCRQLVDFALPFSASIGGLGVTFSTSTTGLGVTFFEKCLWVFWLDVNTLRENRCYAKVLLTNLIETKAGLSPDCFKENFDNGTGESLFTPTQSVDTSKESW